MSADNMKTVTNETPLPRGKGEFMVNPKLGKAKQSCKPDEFKEFLLEMVGLLRKPTWPIIVVMLFMTLLMGFVVGMNIGNGSGFRMGHAIGTIESTANVYGELQGQKFVVNAKPRAYEIDQNGYVKINGKVYRISVELMDGKQVAVARIMPFVTGE